MQEVRLLREPSGSPAWNLALDEALLAGDEPVVRFYGWDPPGLSLGYFQKHDELPLQPLVDDGFVVVRRPTGGGAIAHVGELTFALADRVGGVFFSENIELGYRRVHRAVAAALQHLGADSQAREQHPVESDQSDQGWLCFYKSSSVDLVANDRKLLGSAQRRTRGRVLHHGSLPLQPNPVTPRAISVAELATEPVSWDGVADQLVAALQDEFDIRLRVATPTAAEACRAEQIMASRYSNPSWTRRR